MAGYQSRVFAQPPLTYTTGLGGALGAVLGYCGGCGGLGCCGGLGSADGSDYPDDTELTQPNESPHSGFWDFMTKAAETVPTALVKGQEAYGNYTTTGGGANGVTTALLSILGQNQQAVQAAKIQAAAKAQAEAATVAAATPWYKKPVMLVGLAAVAGIGIWAWRRK